MTLSRDEGRHIAWRIVEEGLPPDEVTKHFPATAGWKYPVEYIRQIARTLGYRWDTERRMWQPYTGPARRRRVAMLEGAMLVIDVFIKATNVPADKQARVRAYMERAAVGAIDKRLDDEYA